MAEKLGIDIEFRGTTVKLDDSLNYISKNIKNLKKDIKALDKDFKLELNADTLKKNIETVTYALAESEKAAELFNKEIASINVDGYTYLNEEGKEVIVTAEEARVKMTQFTASLDAQNTVTKELKKKYDELNRALKNLDTLKSIESLKTLRNELKTTGDVFTTFGNAFSGISTLSTAALGGAFTAAKDFESAFTGVMKTVDETTTTTYDDIEKSIRKMATTLPTSAKEIAGVMEIAGQLGVKADDLEKFSKTMIDLSNATNILGTEGATQVAQFYNVMKGDLQTVDRFGAALTHLGNNSATTEAEILRMATNLAGVGANLRITEQDILGLATGLASVGISAEKGGSAVSNILLKISREVETNGKSLSAWASVAGMSAEEFKKSWNENTVSSFFKVLEGLGTLEDENESLIQVLDDVNVKNIRQIDTLSRLANSYQNLDRYLVMSNDAWNENSALTNEANRRYGTVESQIQVLKNNLTELAIGLGKSLLPVVKDIIGVVSPLVKGLSNWISKNAGLVSSFLMMTAAISPLLTTVGKFYSGTANVVTAIIRIQEASVSASPAISGLAKVIGLGTTAGIVGAAVAATAALGYLLVKIQQSKDETYQASQSFKSAAESFDNVRASAEEAQAASDAQILNLLRTNEQYVTSLDELMLKLQNTNLSEEERALIISQLQEKIGVLNQNLGEEAFVLDEANNALFLHNEQVNSVKQSYDELINQMRIEAWIANNKQAYEEATVALGKYKELADTAQQGYIEATKELNLEHLPLTEEELQKAIQKIGEMGGTKDDVDLLRLAFNEYADEIVNSNGKVNELRNTMETYEGVVSGTITEIGELIGVGETLNSTQNKTTEELLLTKDALIEQQHQYRDTYGTASELISEQLRLVNNELQERKRADEEALKSNSNFTTEASNNFSSFNSSAKENIDGIVNSLDGLKNYQLPEKIQTIRANYVGFDNNFGNTYSANGGGRSSGGRGSGGFGEVKLTTNIHINNNGTPINEQEVNRWVNVITDKLDVALGGKM